jgi:hypothetical protein
MQPTIAHLPPNPYQDDETHPQPTLTPVDNPILNTVDYSDKSFIVFGEGTRAHKDNLKALGGRYNGRLGERPGFQGGPAWIFPIQMKDKVYTYINQTNAQVMPTVMQTGIPGQGGQTGLPTVIMPLVRKEQTFQTVTWKVFRPKEGMKVTVKGNGQQFIGEVVQITENNNIVEKAIISVDGQASELVICCGKWMVWGYMVEHTVFFSDQESPTPSPTPYDDMANI